MRTLVLFLLTLTTVAACSDGDGERRASSSSSSAPSSSSPPEEPMAVTTGSYDPPEGPVPRDPAAIQTEIRAALDARDHHGIGEGTGPGAGRIYVPLRLGREHIADQLLARYGDRIRVDVGGLPWPLTDTEAFERCADPLPAGDAADGLSATVTPSTTTMELGGELTASVVLRNDTSEPVAFGWGGAGVDGHLVRPGSDEPVGMFVGAQTMQFVTTPAEPGGVSEPVNVVIGLFSCTPELHTAVPPGTYELIVILRLMDERTIRSEPVEITITPG